MEKCQVLNPKWQSRSFTWVLPDDVELLLKVTFDFGLEPKSQFSLFVALKFVKSSAVYKKNFIDTTPRFFYTMAPRLSCICFSAGSGDENSALTPTTVLYNTLRSTANRLPKLSAHHASAPKLAHCPLNHPEIWTAAVDQVLAIKNNRGKDRALRLLMETSCSGLIYRSYLWFRCTLMKLNSFDPSVTHGPACYRFWAAISRHTGRLEAFFNETFPAL